MTRLLVIPIVITFMTAQAAKEYGLVDQVLSKRP